MTLWGITFFCHFIQIFRLGSVVMVAAFFLNYIFSLSSWHVKKRKWTFFLQCYKVQQYFNITQNNTKCQVQVGPQFPMYLSFVQNVLDSYLNFSFGVALGWLFYGFQFIWRKKDRVSFDTLMHFFYCASYFLLHMYALHRWNHLWLCISAYKGKDLRQKKANSFIKYEIFRLRWKKKREEMLFMSLYQRL